jgi:hypothetical protein
MRWLAFLLVLVCAAYATAPAWVDNGANVTYAVGNDHINYYVTARNSTDIRITKTNLTSRNVYHLDENPDQTTDNAFWFDSSQLSGTYNGESIDVFTVSGTSTQQFQGMTLNTVTLTQSFGGGVSATTIYDQATGLLLSVSVHGAPASPISILSATIPTVQAYAPPSQTPPPSQPPPSQPPAQNTSNATAPPPVQPAGNNSTQLPPPSTGTPYQPSGGSSGGQPITGVQPYSTKSPFCCSSAFILLVLGFAAILRS